MFRRFFALGILSAFCLLLGAAPANAAEGDAITKAQLADILMPVIGIGLAVILLLILWLAPVSESKAKEFSWILFVVVLVAFIAGTMSGIPYPGKWVRGWITGDSNEPAKTTDNKANPADPQNPTYDAEKGTVTTDNLPPEGQEMFVYWKSATVPPTGSSGGKTFGRTKEAMIVAKDATDVKVVFGTADGSKMSAVTTAKKK